MKNEEVVELVPNKSNQAPFYALILSIVWNLLVLFLLFFVATQKRNGAVTVSSEPLVVFQDPLPPTSFAQNNAPLSIPQPMPAPMAQPMPQTLQQIALQQPQSLQSPEEDKLNYLVKQLISYGNSNWGAVVSAVDDVPDNAINQLGNQKPATNVEQAVGSTETVEESAQEPAATNNATSESEPNPAQESAESESESRDDQSLSNQDIELLQETARSIATTFPEESTGHNKSNSAHARGSSLHRYPTADHQPSRGASHQSGHSKKQLTLADLAHSYMNQVRNDTQTKYNYDPQRKSGTTGRGMPGVYSPASSSCTGKELALQMYATKVFTMMQQSAHALSSLIYANSDFTEHSLLEITIDHTGKLERVALNPPINEKDVELAVQKIVERVGLFPPIPKHFNMDSITLTFPLNIQGAKGFGRYSLSYSTGAP